MPIWRELTRRNVFKVGAAYLIVAWLIAQIVSVIQEPMGLPDWFDTAVLVLLAVGLPVALLFAWAYELTPEGIKKTRTVPLERSVTHLTGQRLNYIVTGLLVLAIAFIAVDNYWLAPASGVDHAGAGSGIGRVAVLPCDNLSPDPNDSYFAPGIHDELLNRLAQIRGLPVISRSSVLQYAESRPPIPEIGETLGVDTIMECGVRYNGDQVVLTAQLIDAVSDEHVWSNTYTGDMTNLESLFDIQSSIAMNVANALRIEFFDQGVERVERIPTESRVAYEHYLLGRSLMRRNTPDAVRDAIEELEQAVAVDPRFGLAHIALGQAYGSVWVLPNPETIERRERAILDAVQFAPDEPGTHLLLGSRFERAWQWAEADAAYMRAVELSPDGFATNQSYGNFLRMAGRLREALPHLQAARSADPAALNPELNLSQAYDALGDHEQAVVHYERTRTLLGVRALPEGQHVYSLVGNGELELAEQHWASLEPLYDEMGAALTGLYRTSIELLDDPAAARDALHGLLDQYPGFSRYPMNSHVANWAAVFDDTELAIEAFRESLRASTLSLVYVWLPIWQNVRATAEFKELIDETGLPEYWRQHGWPEHCRPVGQQDFECG